ncbi:MAG: flagellar biosynthetic protein FliQ [Oscillospiraceae bacterium]|nr:flagellar biosynthetic protein FliQ [Oscillospiraceae bacterium]
MSQSDISELIRAGIMEILWLSLPMLGIGLVAGLIVSIVQATTQVNEQTVVFVVKILSVFVALIIFGSWMLERLDEFIKWTHEMIIIILRTE